MVLCDIVMGSSKCVGGQGEKGNKQIRKDSTKVKETSVNLKGKEQ